MKKIGFIIINYNDVKTTKILIENIKNYKCIDEIVVVDNASNDNSVKELSEINEITLICNEENYGFAKAINIGSKYLIDKYKDIYLIISNSDVRIESEEDVIELINSFKIKNVGLAGPILVEPTSINKGWKRTSVKKDILLNIPLLNKLYKNKIINYPESHYNTHVSYVDIVKGCIFAVDSKALEKIKYLDENTFLYYEENILSAKLVKNNYKIVINNKVTMYHDHSITINKNLNNINKYNILKQSFMYYEKNYNNANKLELCILSILNKINYVIKRIRKK